MAAAARSAEAHTKALRTEVTKPWLGTSEQAQRTQVALRRDQENPYAKYTHLKAIADQRGVDLAAAVGQSQKATDQVYETMRTNDTRACLANGGPKYGKKSEQARFVGGLDYRAYISAALEASHSNLRFDTSADLATDMREQVYRRAVWLPKIADLCVEEDPLMAGEALLTSPSFAAQPARVSIAHLSIGPNGRSSRQLTRMRTLRTSLHCGKQSMKWISVGPNGRLEYAPVGSSAAFVEDLQSASEKLPEPPEAGCISAETSSSRMHLVEPKRHHFPWENQDLLAKRALRTDELQKRMSSLNDKILARKSAVINEDAGSKSGQMPRKSMNMHRRPSTVACMDAAREVKSSETMARRQSAAQVDPMSRLPTDSELEAMDAIAALAKLQDLETQLLSELSNGRQSTQHRLKSSAKGKTGKSKRLVLFDGASDTDATAQNGQLPLSSDLALMALEAITPKRKMILKRLMLGMDTMTRRIGKEMNTLMHRKRAIDNQDYAARQEIRRAELADARTGSGYIGGRFEGMCGSRRPFTAL